MKSFIFYKTGKMTSLEQGQTPTVRPLTSKDQGFTTETKPTAGLGVQRDPWGGQWPWSCFHEDGLLWTRISGVQRWCLWPGTLQAGFVCFVFLDSYVLARDLELSMFSGSAFGAVGACFPGMG